LGRLRAEPKQQAPRHSTSPPKFSSSDQGLSQNQLCKRFGITSNNVAARAKAHNQTSQQYLEERTGWKFDERDRKYYPPI
jgi:hypothetical protein